jgi:hypothetical protein
MTIVWAGLPGDVLVESDSGGTFPITSLAQRDALDDERVAVTVHGMGAFWSADHVVPEPAEDIHTRDGPGGRPVRGVAHWLAAAVALSAGMALARFGHWLEQRARS